ncbi:salivary protein Tsal2A-like [Epargyreus clarus]|uniref:salivary protein Tsal2A-like n=1 Tax=Epargyreus clarus TaxID=520877 RepID=UPI003C2B576D
MGPLLILVTAVLAASFALPTDLPEPGDFAHLLNEDEFEDYLDFWLQTTQPKWANETVIESRNGCTIRVNGDLGQPQPVYIHNNGYLTPTGNTGLIHLSTGEQIIVACTGSGRSIQHPNVGTSIATGTATCVNNAVVSGAGWLNGNGALGELTCSSHSYHEALATTDRCFNNNLVIRVGFTVNQVFYPLYWSCFDQQRLEVLYVWYEQNPQNSVHQTGVDRPSWLAGSFFPGVSINNLYTQVTQKATIAGLVGQNKAEEYITNTQFLARGHLAAKTDFIYATGQRSTFYFINAVPQWQPFNAGNWNWLEQNLRARIGAAGYNTIIFTGSFGVTQLRNANGVFVDIYLHRDSSNNPQLPVPQYLYKVVYDSSRRLGTAFISINNPYYSLAEVRALQFCTDRCRNNTAFNWIGWQPDRIDLGYSFCCTVDEFRRVVPHLPVFTVNDLLS